MVWKKIDFVEDLGLAPLNDKIYAKKKLYIDKGEVDPKSFGGVAVISDANFDGEGGIENLELSYWLVHPDGRHEKQKLIELETEKVGEASLDIKSLWVLGREVSLHNLMNVENVLEACRRIHVELRSANAQVPDIARIFQDCMIEDAIGESLPLPGFNLKSRIYFPATHNFNITAQGAKRPRIEVPEAAFLPIAGLRRNTLDVEQSYIGRDNLRARGFLPEGGKRFVMSSELSKAGEVGDKKKIELKKSSISLGKATDELMVAKAKWTREKGDPEDPTHPDTVVVKNLDILGTNVLRSSFQEVMGALGVMNLSHADMLHARDYPRMQDHLATYGLLDLVQSSSGPPPTSGRFVLTSEGGNNLQEIYPGVGTDIGGNCKTVETHWTVKGDIKKVGAILDFGTYLIKSASEWSAGHPDVVEKLKYCKHIFITHHHLDHIDALIPYIKRGLITSEHTLHMTPEVHAMLHDKLVKMNIKRDDPRRPPVNELEGTGVFDILDDDGQKRLSILYGVDAVPHSAKDTPFIAYGRSGDEILGSYMYLGDMRFDEEWFRIHKTKFWNPVTVMHKREPQLNKDHLIPTYTEIDGTSAKRMGRGASEQEVERNLVHILDKWFYDRHAGLAMIGTNDNRRETILRVGNHTGRKMTSFGSAVETIFRIANKFGVNPYLLGRPEVGKYTGLSDFLKWHAEENDLSPTEYKQRTSLSVKDWFKYEKPGGLLTILSGSQGNPVEFEAMTYKLSDARSLWDANEGTRNTARPTNLKDWVLVFTQGAIPGNSRYQKALIKKLASRGATVLEAFDDSLRIHNPGKLRARILDDLIETGKIKPGHEKDITEADGSIVVEGLSIHASGHGRNGDMRLWLEKLKAKYFGLHHTDDPEAVQVGYDTIEEMGKKHPGNIFDNGIEVEITTDAVKPIGRRVSSIILTREKSEPGKHYNKYLEATRFFNLSDSPHHEMGLRGTVGGPVETSFGTDVFENVHERFKAKEDFNTHVAANSEVKPRRQYEGAEIISIGAWDPKHPALTG